MTKKPTFLAALNKATAPDPEPLTPSPVKPVSKPPASRVGQKHLGAYIDKTNPLFERVAILRARLDMTNSELIEHALNELWARHEAGRKFGD